MSSHSSYHPHEVRLARLSLQHVHKDGLKPRPFNFLPLKFLDRFVLLQTVVGIMTLFSWDVVRDIVIGICTEAFEAEGYSKAEPMCTGVLDIQGPHVSIIYTYSVTK